LVGCWLILWLIGWLSGWLVQWLVDWSTGELFKYSKPKEKKKEISYGKAKNQTNE